MFSAWRAPHSTPRSHGEHKTCRASLGPSSREAVLGSFWQAKKHNETSYFVDEVDYLLLFGRSLCEAKRHNDWDLRKSSMDVVEPQRKVSLGLIEDRSGVMLILVPPVVADFRPGGCNDCD